ncbi:MAG TPA: hypothetical protein VFY39_14380 [Gammaproteobacteria bacterium]|nr:hypothetical protein [Gammaproteobacteria bacterium]
MPGASRMLAASVAAAMIAGPSWAQHREQSSQEHITVGANELLVDGADAIRAGRYDDGIRLTSMGLKHAQSIHDRAAGLANLCAAYASKKEADKAIGYCTQSLHLDAGNWKAYSIRSYAYVLKGMYFEATLDNNAAAAISPDAPHVKMVRGMLNEHKLRPYIVVEDH